MKHSLVALLFGVTCIAYADPVSSQPLSWYNGTVKIDIYPQSGLCVLPVNAQSGGQRTQDTNAVGERNGWRIYRTSDMSARSAQTRCKPFWTSAETLENSTDIYAEPDGILVQFNEGMSTAQVEQWFAAEGVHGEPQSLPRSYLIKPVSSEKVRSTGVSNGEAMIRLSERIMTAKPSIATFAIPNWLGQSNTR